MSATEAPMFGVLRLYCRLCNHTNIERLEPGHWPSHCDSPMTSDSPELRAEMMKKAASHGLLKD